MCLRVSLQGGATVDAVTTDKGETPLNWATKQGKIQVVEALLNAGADKALKVTGGGPMLVGKTAL